MKSKLAVILAGLMFVLAGCSAISAGTITDKEYHEAYDYPSSYCSMYNSKSVCVVWSQRWNHVKERYVLVLKDKDKEGWVDVSYGTYDQYKIGDYFGEKK